MSNIHTTKIYWDKKWQEKPKMPVNDFARKCYVTIKNKGFKKLLDLGCGLGADSLYFARKGFQVTALDCSQKALEKVNRLHPNIKIIQQDIRNLNFKNESFDLIYAHLSLQYFNDQETTNIFNKLFSILKKGGYIFVKCKSINDPIYGKGKKMGKDMYRYKKGNHTRHFFSEEYMRNKLEKFKILKIRKSSLVYNKYKSNCIETIAMKD